LDPINQLLNVLPNVLILGFVNFFISGVIAAKNKWLVFVIPGILLVAALILFTIGMIKSSDGWAALGYLIFAGFATIGFIATFLSSLLWLFIKKPEKL